MRLKHALMATTAAVFLTIGGFAQAQQASPPRATDTPAAQSTMPGGAADRSTASLPSSTLHEIKDNNASVPALNVSVKDLDGMDIYGADGKKIGDVKRVLADNSNTIKAVTVDVGGFLGMGAREVVLPVEKLQKGTEKDRLQVSMNKSDIEKLDKWENADRTTPGSRPAAPATTPNR